MINIDFLLLLTCFTEVIGSNYFANVLSFLEFIVALTALVIGGKKVSELISEYNARKHQAIFSYHINLKIYIKRIKKLTTDNTGAPLKTLYQLSSIKVLRDESNGYETLSKNLYNISQNFLNYLSSTSEQIPATDDYSKIKKWDALLEKMVDFLLDFTLYGSGAYLPSLKDTNSIIAYHHDLINTLTNIEKMIKVIENKYINELKNERETLPEQNHQI